jgi:hypothetical protein
MKDYVFDLQTITRHDEPGDRIIEQFIQRWLTVAGVHGATLPNVRQTRLTMTRRQSAAWVSPTIGDGTRTAARELFRFPR